MAQAHLHAVVDLAEVVGHEAHDVCGVLGADLGEGDGLARDGGRERGAHFDALAHADVAHALEEEACSAGAGDVSGCAQCELLWTESGSNVSNGTWPLRARAHACGPRAAMTSARA